MVMILLSANAETEHHYIQESRLRQHNTSPAVVIASRELQLVYAGTIVITFQQRGVATAVAVCLSRRHKFQALAFNAIEFDADIAAWAAVSGIQYMSS